MKRRIFSLPLLCVASMAIAQIPIEPANLQSPNVAALGLYGDIPVSQFTGTPSIEIPLYRIVDNDIDIPVSLSYHSSGVRPDQRPGWTGLGWSLQAGGAIYRTVNDSEDEYHNPSPGLYLGTRGGYYYRHNILNVSTWNSLPYLREIAQDVEKYGPDIAPDEFSFNFLGYSGKFYLDHLGQWQVQCDKPVKVEFNGTFLEVPFEKHGLAAENVGYSHTFSGFTIYGEDGTAYIFGGNTSSIEYSLGFFRQYDDEWKASAWHLTQIITPKGDTATFTYERRNFTNQMYISVFQNIFYATQSSNGSFPVYNCSSWGTPPIPLEGYHNGKLLSPIYLTDITTSNARLSFDISESIELDYQEEDYEWHRLNFVAGGTGHPSFLGVLKSEIDGYPACLEKLKWYKLDTITVSDNNERLLKKIKFEYDNSDKERLRLSSVKEEASNGKQKVYSFGYNPGTLPGYLSNRTDHWGFFNNKYARTDLYDYYYQDRNPTPQVLLYGVLNKITYPTGGYTRFEFEPHSYRRQLKLNRWEGFDNLPSNEIAGGLRIKKIFNSASGNSLDEILDKEYFYTTDFLTNGTNSNVSSGVLGGRIQYGFSNYTVYAFNDNNVRTRMSIFSSQSVLPACINSQGSHIGYSEVIERNHDGSFTRFRFTNFDNGHLDNRADMIIQESHTPYEPYSSRECERGKILLAQEYSANGVKKHAKGFQYERSSENYVRSMKAASWAVCPFSAIGYDEGSTYRYYTYVYRLKQETDTVYDTPSNPVSVTKSYGYNRNGLIKEISQTTNNGTKKISYRRPDEYTSGVYPSMVTKHILSPVVEESESLQPSSGSSRPLSKKRLNYVSVPTSSGNIFTISSIEDSIGTSNWRKIYECLTFDNKGNPVSITMNGTPIVYQWDYNKLSPTAIFENARNNTGTGASATKDVFYESFESLSSTSAASGYYSDKGYVGSYTVSMNTILRKEYVIDYRVFKSGKWEYVKRDFTNGSYTINESNYPIDDVRVYPKNARVTTSSYYPLLGIRSITNERGITESYEYDSFGRLTTVKDNDLNIIEFFDYNYLNQ